MLAYTLIDDPAALYWVAGLLAVGLVLYLAEKFFGKKQLRPPGAERGDPRGRRTAPCEQGALIHARIVATDGSRASLVGARQFKWIADSREITDVTVVAVVSPYAAVPVRQRAGTAPAHRARPSSASADEAEVAVDLVAAEFDGWGPTIHKQVRSGSPAQEIVRAAEDLDADLISMAAGSRGLTRTILLGSTASRVQHSAPCPVLVCRPTPKSERATTG